MSGGGAVRAWLHALSPHHFQCDAETFDGVLKLDDVQDSQRCFIFLCGAPCSHSVCREQVQIRQDVIDLQRFDKQEELHALRFGEDSLASCGAAAGLAHVLLKFVHLQHVELQDRLLESFPLWGALLDRHAGGGV